MGAAVLPGCGVFVLQRDYDSNIAKMSEFDKATHDELVRLHGELEATRDRLDNALRANADTGSDLLSEKSRINDVAGRLDETNHKLEELQSTLAAGRNELDARFDQLSRAQAAQAAQQAVPPPPPPPPIPETRKITSPLSRQPSKRGTSRACACSVTSTSTATPRTTRRTTRSTGPARPTSSTAARPRRLESGTVS
jgi:TolA-binding protein